MAVTPARRRRARMQSKTYRIDTATLERARGHIDDIDAW